MIKRLSRAAPADLVILLGAAVNVAVIAALVAAYLFSLTGSD